MLIRKRAWLLALPLGLLGACTRTAPMLDNTVAAFIGNASLAQRGEQIQLGAATRGWTTLPQRPGLIRATLNLRTHQAVVDIAYDTERFTIRHVSSINLDEGGGLIHSNYNAWIQYLQQSIVSQPTPPPPPVEAPPPAPQGRRRR